MIALLALSASIANAGALPYSPQTMELNNGLEVVVIETDSPGVVAYFTWMQVGSRDETVEGRTGFAHFFEHLMFLGTESMSGDEREAELLRMAAQDNAWTWFDETVYHVVAPVDALPRLVEMEADRFQHLALTADDVQREAGAVYGEFRKSQASVDRRLHNTTYATAFTAHTYHHSTLGYEADIAAMPTAFEYSQLFFSQFYRPERATVYVVGDVKPAEVFPLVEAAYSSWTPGAVTSVEEHVIPVEPPQNTTRREHIDWPSPTATRLQMAWRIPGDDPDDPEIAALDLAARHLLGDVGPLRQRLVRDEGLALEVSGGRDDHVDECLFRIQVTLKDDVSVEAVEAVIREEVAKVVAGVEEDTLSLVQSSAKYSFLLRLDEPANVAEGVGWAARRGGGVDSVDRFYATFDALDAATVAASVDKWLVDAGLTVVTVSHASDPGSSRPDGGAEGGAR